eukprot:SAG31_NODE_44779_length_261_cov_0.864198_1_plen_23_part_10
MFLFALAFRRRHPSSLVHGRIDP